MSIIGPLWVLVIVGSMVTAALLAGAGVLFWRVRRADNKKLKRQ